MQPEELSEDTLVNINISEMEMRMAVTVKTKTSQESAPASKTSPLKEFSVYDTETERVKCWDLCQA